MHYGYMTLGSFGFVWMVIFWAALIWWVVWLVNKSKESQPRAQVTPLEILKERYAKGELSKKQYGDMKKEVEH